MERRVDIGIVFGCCIVCLGLHLACGAPDAAVAGTASANTAPSPFAAHPTETASVIAALLAIIAAVGFDLLPRRVRAAAPVALCLAVAIAPGGIFLLPVAVYELMRCIRDGGPSRYAIAAVPLALAFAVALHSLTAVEIAAAVVAGVLAGVLSARTSRILAQRALAQRTRDDLQRRALSLQREKTELADEVRMLHGRVRGTDGHPATRLDAGDSAACANAPAPRPAAFAQLTEREYEIVRLVAEGLDNHEIAAAAFISEGTVRNRISQILAKTGLKNRTQVAVTWWRG